MKSIERFYQYLDFKDIKPTRFEKEFGMSNGYLSTQMKRKGDLGESILNTIIDNCLDINPIWLLTGKGEMLQNDTKSDINVIYTKELEERVCILERQVLKLLDILEGKDEK